ncbi:MAG TPA: hypothetical protein VGF99_10655, partial [Myxococcota bacterium]
MKPTDANDPAAADPSLDGPAPTGPAPVGPAPADPLADPLAPVVEAVPLPAPAAVAEAGRALDLADLADL